MKKNNKGFMLAEVVVTATLLLAIMISLYFTFNKIYARYNNVTNYKNIDGMYAIENVIEYMYTGEGENNINNILKMEEQNYKYIIQNGNCNLLVDYCNKLKGTYNINNLLIVKQIKVPVNDNNQVTEKPIVETLDVTNKTFKDYLKYISKYYAYDNYTKDSYLFIIEYNPQNKEIIKDSETGIETEKYNNYDYSSLELR